MPKKGDSSGALTGAEQLGSRRTAAKTVSFFTEPSFAGTGQVSPRRDDMAVVSAVKPIPVRVYQLRPGARIKSKRERTLAKNWTERVAGQPGKLPARTDPSALEKRLWTLVQEVLPSDERNSQTGKIIASNTSNLPQALSGPNPAGTALAEYVWSYGQSIVLTAHRHVLLGTHQAVRVLLQAVTDVLYPPHLRTHRAHVTLEMTQLALMNINSLLYVILAPQSLRARGVLNLLPHRESTAIRSGLFDSAWRRAIRSVIRRQRNAALGGGGWGTAPEIAGVYQRDNNMIGYTGLANEWRKNTRERTGTLICAVEHGEKVRRPHRPQAKQKRYREWRRGAVGTHGSLTVRRERKHVASAMELQAIRSTQMRGNVKGRKAPQRRGKHRGRPPPWDSRSTRHRECKAPRREPQRDPSYRQLYEEMMSKGPLDTAVAKGARKRLVRAAADKEKGGDNDREKQRKKWELPWGQAYAAAQKTRFEHSGLAGPIDIREPKWRRLLLIYFANPRHPPINWKRIEKRWKDPLAALRVSRSIRKLRSSERMRRAWKQIDRRVQEKNLPSRRQLHLKTPGGGNAGVLRSMAMTMMRQTRGTPSALKQWIGEHLQVRADRSPTFFDKRNAAAAVKAAKYDETLKAMKERKEEVFDGEGWERIPNSSKIPVAMSPADVLKATREPLPAFKKLLTETIPGAHEHQIRIPEAKDSWHARITEDLPRSSPPARRAHEKYAKQYEQVCNKPHGETTEPKVACPEDKSPKETWFIPILVYQALTLASCATAGWTRVKGLSKSAAEYGVRGYIADHTIPRLRKTLGAMMNAPKPFIPYLYNSIKKKCFDGPAGALRTCFKAGHSCTRKIVSFINLYGRKRNKLFHRGGQTILEPLPSWELWGLDQGPTRMREHYDQLVYDPRFERVCILCGGPKKPVGQSVCDSPQAYEQILSASAVTDLQWCAAKSQVMTGENTVSINTLDPRRSTLGGKVSNLLNTSAPVFVVTFAEATQYISTFFVMVLVTVGDVLFKAPGIMIGNPMGRLALAVTTTKDAVTYDEKWRNGIKETDQPT